jgi:hypothetical protein
LGEFGDVTGMDASLLAIRHCTERFGDRFTLTRGRVPEDVPTDRPFDVVCAFDVLEHLDDDVGAAKGFSSVLTANGIFVCTVPAFQSLWTHHDDLNEHRRRYSRSQLHACLIAAGLQPTYMSYFNSVLFPLALASRLTTRMRNSTRDEFAMPRSSVNRLLAGAFSSERRMIRGHVRLPVGLSIIAIARAA